MGTSSTGVEASAAVTMDDFNDVSIVLRSAMDAGESWSFVESSSLVILLLGG